MGTPQDPPYPTPPPPSPVHEPDSSPDPNGDDPKPDPRPSAIGEQGITFTQSPYSKQRLDDFVDWLLKIDANDSTLVVPKAERLASTRDPRLDPRPGDVLRYSGEEFPRRVLECEGDSVLIEIGENRLAMTLNRWRRWAHRKRAVTVQAVAFSEDGS